MKQRWVFLVVLLALSFPATQAWAQALSGNYTIDVSLPTESGNYNTFKEACDALTANGVSGNVTFTIASGTYNETGKLLINPLTNKPAVDKTVTFVVAGSSIAVVNVAYVAGDWVWSIGDAANAVDYVTIDGSNSGGSDRSLTINAGDATTGYYGMLIFGDNITVKNVVISLGNPWSVTPAQGLVLHQTNASDNCTVQNCDITANYGILIGTTTGTSQTGNTINNNTVHCWNRGIYAAQSVSILIQDNTVIGNATLYPTATVYGIYVSGPAGNTGSVAMSGNTITDLGTNSGATAAVTIHSLAAYGSAYFTISNNKIWDLYNATAHTTTNVGLHAIYLSGGTDHVSRYEVFNNCVAGMWDNDGDLSGNWTAGIRVNTVGRVNVYHNSVYVAATTPARQHSVAAFMCSTNSVTTTDTLFVTNNVFWCNAAGYSSAYKSHGFYKGGSFLGRLVSDYNCIYNDGGGVNSYNAGSTSTTLANWTAGQDLHSVCKAVSFVDPAYDLHLTGGSLGDLSLTATPNLGWTVAVQPADMDGQARSVSTPYMGADEIPGSPLPVQLVAFTASTTQQSAVLQWSTATEANCYGFEIERRAVSGQSAVSGWQKIGFVAGSGTSPSTHDYSFTDSRVESGRYAYRLKQIDQNGSFRYFGSAEVEVGLAPKALSLGDNYPNPFNPSTTLSFSVPQDGHATLRVFNVIGQEVATLYSGVAEAGKFYTRSFDASRIPTGIYFARLEFGNQSLLKKMMLVK